MKVFKYPEVKSNNFGITPEGELYAGDLTQSGKKTPLSRIKTVQHLNGHAVSRRTTAFKTLANISVNVNGPSVFRPQSQLPQSGTFLQPNHSITLRGGNSLAPFKSVLGDTAGKTYFPTHTGMILDENGDVAFNVVSTSRDTISTDEAAFAQRTGDTYVGPAGVLFETERRLYILIQPSISGYTHLIWVRKLRHLDATNEGNVGFGYFDVEYLGRDVLNRVLLAFHVDNYSSSGFSTAVAPGAPGSVLHPGTGFILRQRNQLDVFDKAADYRWGANSSATSDGLGTGNNYSFLSTSLCAPAKEIDQDGKLLSIGFLTHGNVAAPNTTSEVTPAPLNWTKIIFTETPTVESTQISIPVSTNGKLRRPNSSTDYFGSVIQCSQFISDNKLYAVFSNGPFARYRENTNVTIPVLPVTIMEADVLGSSLASAPVFFQIEQDAHLDFYNALVDAKAKRIWWLSDTIFAGSNFHVRCLDLQTRSLDHLYMPEAFVSAGAQNGNLLLVTVPNNPDTSKWVLTPESKRARIKLAFDQVVYTKGNSGKLNVSVTGNERVLASIQLSNSTFLDGAKEKEVILEPNQIQTLDVLVQQSPYATVASARRYIEEPST